NVAILAPPWRPLRSFFVFRWFDVSANQRFLPGRTGRVIFFVFIILDYFIDLPLSLKFKRISDD
ncbi:MAG: hypothetical protein LBE14_04330, partial [Treponema sp.]|nr:hypothetical protein [Treponema sp.]